MTKVISKKCLPVPQAKLLRSLKDKIQWYEMIPNEPLCRQFFFLNVKDNIPMCSPHLALKCLSGSS